MKRKHNVEVLRRAKNILAGLVLSGPLMLANGAFATNPYGINYEGGVELGPDNVVSNPDLLDGLTLAAGSNHKGDVVTYSNTSKWELVYRKSGEEEKCTPLRAIRVNKDTPTSYFRDVYYTISNDKYTLKIDINNVFVEDLSSSLQDGQSIAVFVGSTGHINSLRKTYYSDATCTNEIDDIVGFNYADNVRSFVDTTVNLYHTQTNKLYVSDQLYVGLIDIDAGQSFKIMNSGNKLTANKMYAKDANNLQPQDSENRNMFVSNDNYIYATGSFDIIDGNNIYVKLNTETQEDGLNVIFGFASGATAGVEYYAKVYIVNYKSNPEGEITGIKTEEVISGDSPSSSIATPKESYEFDYWTADKDVTLSDGTIIKAGKPISSEQIKNVVVHSDITFTAAYKEVKTAPATPNTGVMPEEDNGIAAVSVSIVGVAVGALIVGLTPKLVHKKVKFNK